ncbi:DNA polymerase III subunit delta [Bhargavaea beijingensis]|uniref:DNA polymerase III subunit delta n=1 Tax=Bhargavaea beijingensis TaxID=426756 RepID=A0A1G7CPJ9_9BACL|nr:DNA polymerase III subunit delta [Bhargavaea beijingensis]MCW1927064.1 DNA polymerase III subunit delta [Bhargavaea beijingensis]RSK30794.1 DNA polymerase III subunit delta [Bhargavaea beijingensis]SDE41141.1 DNA polymerase III, delta subunit [Bhargavaea beijingensis]
MFTDSWRNMAKGNIAPVYLVSGPEMYFFDETEKRLKDAMPDAAASELTTFDLDETPVEAVIEEADTFPFFCDRKLIIARNASFLKAADKGKDKVEHDLDKLMDWLAHPPESAVVLFLAPYEKLDARKKVVKAFRKHAVCLEAESLKTHDVETWIKQEAARLGSSVSDSAARLLIETAGEDLVRLRSELEKLSLYTGEGKEVGEDAVSLLVAKTPEDDAFKLLDAYMQGDSARALQIYRDLLHNKEEPIRLNALLANQVRLIIQVNALKKKGYQQHQIAKQLRVHPYRIKLIMENRKLADDARLLGTLARLADADLRLKTVSGNRERVLELVLMQKVSGIK